MHELPNEISITIPIEPDKDGWVGCECPACGRYFKVKPGSGTSKNENSWCPYCGYEAVSRTFISRSLVDHARQKGVDEALAQVMDHITYRLAQAVRGGRGGRGGRGKFSELSTRRSVRPARPRPAELDVETETRCNGCGFVYDVYGVFAWCPDCKEHNALNILTKVVEMLTKDLASIADEPRDQFRRLGRVLQDAVAQFDAFGREACRVRGHRVSSLTQVGDLSFQNVQRARKRVQSLFGIDFAGAFSSSEWADVCRMFQKRHLLAHRAGVVDSSYLSETGDSCAVVGRKVPLTAQELERFLAQLVRLGQDMVAMLPAP